MLIGQVDVKQESGTCLWELKCVGHLESIHALQLVIYAWLVEHDIGTSSFDRVMSDAGIKPVRTTRSSVSQLLLYNIKTDQLMEVSLSDTSADPLGQIIYDTIQERYGSDVDKISDLDFVTMCKAGYSGVNATKPLTSKSKSGGLLRIQDSSSDED
jgi:hypothetical protein